MVSCAPSSDSPDEIRIGLLTSQTEEFVPVTQAALAGAELAVDHLHRGGGVEIAGRAHRIVLVVESAESTPEDGLRATRKLIARDGVVALIGPFTTTGAIPAGSAAERAHIPMITPTASGSEVTRGKRYVFRVSAGTDAQARMLARFAREELTARRAALLYDIANAYNRSYADAFEAAFAEFGGEIVASETYTSGALDFRESLGRIRDAEPDVVYLPNYPSDVPAQARQLRASGLEAVLLGGDAWKGILPDDLAILEGAFYSHHWHPEMSEEPVRAFVESYRRTYGEVPHPAAALTYEALGLLVRAMETADSLDGERVREALAGLEGYEGVTGRISFRGHGDPIRSLVVVQIRQGRSWLYKQVAAENPPL